MTTNNICLDIPVETLSEIAQKAARRAGQIQLEYLKENLEIEESFKHDIKLKADKESESAIFKVLKEELSNPTILAEESGQHKGDEDLWWIIDPLDGTMNYFMGQHHFCVCIACYHKDKIFPGNDIKILGEPVLGVVYAPFYDEMFVGIKGKGATLNGENIKCPNKYNMDKAMVTTSYGSNESEMNMMEKLIPQLARKTRKLRIQGSCGLDIAGIACGRLNGLIQRNIRCWDFAASRVILEEAGGKLHATEYSRGIWQVIATDKKIHNEFIELVTQTQF